MDDAQRKHRKLTVDGVKRELIRSAAKKLFAVSGLDGTSVREIAKLAGYTTGAIYFHYGSKEELYADILRDS
ncbi:TetR/AcrR family transcriptional regulator [Bradyrhizobium sp. RDT10]